MRWNVTDEDLRDLNVAKARDLVVECFMEAQKETFMRLSQQLGDTPSDIQLREGVVGKVRHTFEEVGGNYDEPSSEILEKVVGRLAKAAASLGTPEDIIEHHKSELSKVFSKLKES
ncbi:hypothetical protein K9M79_08830 [Candidatus Woesearchaeota archaeon]|nr:hypothetical protein [Candidatus Woesearchaeota archaeon]